MVGDVDALQGLYLRGVGPPLVALVVAGAAAVVRAATVLPVAGCDPRRRPARRRRRRAAARRRARPLAPAAAQAAARGELTGELVELLRGAPELVAYGREDDALGRVRAADGELAPPRPPRRPRRRGSRTRSRSSSRARRVAGVLAVAVAAHDAGALDRVLVATLALLALASFEAVCRSPAPRASSPAMLAAGRRVLELIEREPVMRDPANPRPGPPARTRRPRERDRPLQGRGARRSAASTCGSTPAGASRWSARAAPARRP